MSYTPAGCSYTVTVPPGVDPNETFYPAQTLPATTAPLHVHASFPGDPSQGFAVNWGWTRRLRARRPPRLRNPLICFTESAQSALPVFLPVSVLLGTTEVQGACEPRAPKLSGTETADRRSRRGVSWSSEAGDARVRAVDLC